MSLTLNAVRTVSCGAALAVSVLGYGQNYPTKPVRLVVSGVAGSSNITARLIAPSLSDALGQQVVVDGRDGGVIVNDLVAKAQPDGYTLILNGSALWLLPYMRSNVPYDPVRDFAPVTLAVSSPNILVVHPTVPAKTTKDLIALAKAKPGELNCATGNAGTSNHLAAELFKSMAAVNIVRVPYKGGGPAITDLLGGQVQLMFASASSVTQHVKSGKLRALGVSSLKPSALAPGLPTIAATGLPGYESVAIFGILAPARTPTAIVRKLSEETVRVLNRADVKEKFFAAGSETVGSTPEQFATAIKSEMSRIGKVIKDAGIRDE
jgi:tripartite-type tricarboxylate transporter receptor subunit TctC